MTTQIITFCSTEAMSDPLFQSLYSLKPELAANFEGYVNNQNLTVKLPAGNRYYYRNTNPTTTESERLLSRNDILRSRSFRNNNSQTEDECSNLLYPFDFWRNTFADGNVSELVSHNLEIISNTFDYNWTAHKEILETNKYLPICYMSDNAEFSVLLDLFFKTYTYANSSNLELIRKRQEKQADFLKTLKFVFWKPNEYSYTHENLAGEASSIYSVFPKEFFTALKGSIINYDTTSGDFSDLGIQLSLNQERAQIDCHRHVRQVIPPDNSGGGAARLPKSCRSFLSSCAQTTRGSDFFFIKNSSVESLMKEKLATHSNNRLQVIKLPAWKTKSSDQTIAIGAFTKNQCLKRQISFFGIIYHSKILLGPESVKIIKRFGLASFGNKGDLTVSSRALKRFKQFIDDLTYHEGIKIYNPKKAAELMKQLYAGLNSFSSYCCSQLDQAQLQQLLMYQEDLYRPLTTQQNKLLTAQPKIPLAIKRKYNKISSAMASSAAALVSNKLDTANRDLNYQLRAIKQWMEQVKQAEEQKKTVLSDLVKSIEQIVVNAYFLYENKSIYTTIKNQYTEKYETALIENSNNTSEFFNNLANSGIKITEIKFSTSKQSENTLNFAASLDDYSAFIKLANNFKSPFDKEDAMVIKEIALAITTPVKIQVDSRQEFVVGGPYKVKATRQNLSIALLQKDSLFGSSGDSFCIHPHTTTFTSLSRLFNYTTGCLGEASALLYSAFEKNDLKLIVMSIMTWVSSANSSDSWGRKYDWFPPLNQVNFDEDPKSSSNELTEIEVGDFLEQACENLDDEEITVNATQNTRAMEGDLTLIEELIEEEALTTPTIEDDNPLEITIPMPVHNPVETTVMVDDSINPPPTEATAVVPSWNPQDFTIPQTTYTPVFNNSDHEN